MGDDAVDRLVEQRRAPDVLPRDPVEAAVDVLRVLQGWVSDDAAGRWFHARQQRLRGRSPIDALAEGAFEDVEDSARAWAAAHS